MGFPPQNNPKNVDPSYQMHLDFLDCFRMEKHFLTELHKNDLHICDNFGRIKTYLIT